MEINKKEDQVEDNSECCVVGRTLGSVLPFQALGLCVLLVYYLKFYILFLPFLLLQCRAFKIRLVDETVLTRHLFFKTFYRKSKTIAFAF